MNFIGFRRPDGTFGVRNHILVAPADEYAFKICQRVAETVQGAVALAYPDGISLESPQDLLFVFKMLSGAVKNPNVGGVVIVAGSSDEGGLADKLAAEAAMTGKMVEAVIAGICGDVAGATAAAIRSAVKIGREISTCRRELAPVSKLILGVCFDEDIDDSDRGVVQAVFKCCDLIIESNGRAIFNTVPKTSEAGNYHKKILGKLDACEAPGKKPGTYLMNKSPRTGRAIQLMAAVGAQVAVVPGGQIKSIWNPLAPVLRIAPVKIPPQNPDNFELDLRMVFSEQKKLEDIGLLILSEVLATASGKMTWEELLR